MRPRLRLPRSALACISRSLLPESSRHQVPICLRLAQKRWITAVEKPLPEAEQQGPGPNQEQLPHVSEEAAITGKITGEGGPDIEQGTPVQEVCSVHGISDRSSLILCIQILQRDKDSLEKAPRIMQDEAKKSSPTGTRSFSTSTRRTADIMVSPQGFEMQTQTEEFGVPELPLPSSANMKHRYDPLVKQVTSLLMRDGKLSVAQRVRPPVLLSALYSPTNCYI